MTGTTAGGSPRRFVFWEAGRIVLPSRLLLPQPLDQLHLARVIDGMAGDAEHPIELLRFGQGRPAPARADIGDGRGEPALLRLDEGRHLAPREPPSLGQVKPILALERECPG